MHCGGISPHILFELCRIVNECLKILPCGYSLIEILWSNLTLEQNISWIWLSAGTPMLVVSTLARLIDWFLSVLLVSCDKVIFFLNNACLSYSVLNTSKTTFSLSLRRVYLDLRYISLNKQKRVLVTSNQWLNWS